MPGCAQSQMLLVQELEQQSSGRSQVWPRGAHWQVVLQTPLQQVVPPPLQPVPTAAQLLHWPLSQRPLQQSPSPPQAPVDLHEQVPLVPQIPLQQSPPLPQAVFTAAQPQAPVLESQLPEQQSLGLMQAVLSAEQAHTLLVQVSVQQSPSLAHEVPPALQRQPERKASQLPEQQSPGTVQALPGAPQQAPSTQASPDTQLPAVQALDPGTQLAPDCVKLVLHVKSQAPPLQTAVPFEGATQGAHELPHDCGLALARHNSPQAWKPPSQTTSQTPAEQLATPCVGTGQALQEPQWSGSWLESMQLPPHMVGALDGQRSVQAKLPPPVGAHNGVVPLHMVVQAPQLAGLPRLVSQPGDDVQLPNPGRQAPVSEQLPTTQTTLAPSTLGRAVQSLAQLPQWCTSVASRIGSQAPVDRSSPRP